MPKVEILPFISPCVKVLSGTRGLAIRADRLHKIMWETDNKNRIRQVTCAGNSRDAALGSDIAAVLRR